MTLSIPSIAKSLDRYQTKLPSLQVPVVEGHLTRVVGLTMEAVGFRAEIGCPCEVILTDDVIIDAEVVGFCGDKFFLMPVKALQGVFPGARVRPKAQRQQITINEDLLGRVINGLGQALDNRELSVSSSAPQSLSNNTINPLLRAPIKEPLDVGIRAINALIPVGKGQRLGLFAGSGVGKSVLLGMMTRFTEADIVVVGLIGERGREVKEFIETSLGEEGIKRSIVVAAPADDSPLMRLRAARLASDIAEYFRDQGKSVLLLMDSLTRYAQAQREIALAIGEPPATKGYPPSVFTKIPELVERAGNGMLGGGSITAFYTVLTEGDDLQDPVADAARAILDGHVVLSREMAESGIYPAIDIEMSVSRVITSISTQGHIRYIQYFKQLLANYQKNHDLISIGAYTKGSDKHIDIALEYFSKLQKFIQQDLQTRVMLEDSFQQLASLIEPAIALAEAE